LFAVACTARAQLSGHISVLSDYRYRGESLSDGKPAVQAGLDYQHSSGIFIGALATTVDLDPEVSGVGAQLYGGYARALSQRLSWEVGMVTYVFPHPQTEPGYSYTEAFIGINWQNAGVRLYYSDNYFGAGGSAGYVELNATQPISSRVRLLEHLGYLQQGKPRSAGASQDRSLIDAQLGVGITVAGFQVELSVIGTSDPHGMCPAGSGHCGTTGLVSVSRRF
jgi:uncharacterized protein (TIGR02001 family)